MASTEGVAVKEVALDGGEQARRSSFRDKFRAFSEPAIEWLIRVCGFSAVLFVFSIFFFVFREAAPILFGKLNLYEFLFTANWNPQFNPPQYGILALIVGTASVALLAMLFAVPLGLGAAVFLSEFCPLRVRETLKIVIELLAAIPSVVWGFIGVMLLAPVITATTGAVMGANLLNGGLILALMSVPIIMSVGEDALKAVPDSYREAAIALGASRWEVVYRVLFPAAKNGLLAAVLLGVGRSIAETMAVLMCTGQIAQIPHSVLDPVRTLTATLAAGMKDAFPGNDQYRVLFVIGIVLFSLTFLVSLTADMIVKGTKGKQND